MKLKNFLTGGFAACALLATSVLVSSCSSGDDKDSDGYIPAPLQSMEVVDNGDEWTFNENRNLRYPTTTDFGDPVYQYFTGTYSFNGDSSENPDYDIVFPGDKQDPVVPNPDNDGANDNDNNNNVIIPPLEDDGIQANKGEYICDDSTSSSRRKTINIYKCKKRATVNGGFDNGNYDVVIARTIVIEYTSMYNAIIISDDYNVYQRGQKVIINNGGVVDDF